ncbi:MAG: D-alanine--D-alanine ligase family protein [bacterium]
MAKTKVAVIFGGTNTEHEVSLQSAKAILDNLDRTKFDVLPIKITKANQWVPLKLIENTEVQQLATAEINNKAGGVTTTEGALTSSKIDIVFPVLHGPYGEDGTIQGLLELMHLPYVGCGVAASAVCMDKVLQKNICRDYNVPVVPFYWLTSGDWNKQKDQTLANLHDKIGDSFPLFVKPANQGSSVGITKAHNKKELIEGIELALTRDTKVIIEVGVSDVREIECSVLGNYDPQTSVLGEIIPGNEFYDYKAKYIDNNSTPVIPVNIPTDLSDKIRATARLAYQILGCEGMARVDFLLDKETNKYYLNELNTIPGFTPISMYPKLWEASGLSYQDLLTRLIELGIERHIQKAKLNSNL